MKKTHFNQIYPTFAITYIIQNLITVDYNTVIACRKGKDTVR